MAVNKKRGAVQAVTELRQQGSVSGGVAMPVQVGLEKSLAQVASGFAALGSQIGAMADHAAGVEEARKGAQAGRDPGFEPRRDLTIRGEAYDRAGLETAAARVSTEVEGELAQLTVKYKGNPQGFQKAIGEKHQAWLGQTPVELHARLDNKFKATAAAFQVQAAREQAARVAAEHRASVQDDVLSSLKGLQQRAMLLGTGPQADEVLTKDLGALKSTLSARGPDGQPVFSPSARADILRRAERGVADARLMGAYDGLKSLTAKRAFIDSIENDFKRSTGTAAVYDLQSVQAITHRLEAQYRRDQLVERTKISALASDIKAIAKMAEKGYPVPPDQLAAVRTKVEAADNPAASAALSVAENTLAFQRMLVTMPPAQLEAMVNAETAKLKSHGASPLQVARVEMSRRILDEMKKGLRADVWGWAERAGMPPPPAIRWGQTVDDGSGAGPVDLGVHDIRQRIARADTLAAHYGIAPQYFTKADKEALGKAIAGGGAPLIQVAGTIAEAFDGRADQAFAELGRVKGSSGRVLALFGKLVADGASPIVVRDVANGISLRRSADYKPLAPPVKIAHPLMKERYGKALAAYGPGMIDTLRDLANAAYEVRARREQLTEFDAEKYREVLDQVAGAVTVGGTTYGGIGEHRSGWFDGHSARSVVVPPGVRRDRFDDVVGLINNADLDGTGQVPYTENGTRLAADALRRGMFVSVGPGKYWVALGDPESDAQWLLDKNGRRLEFDLGVLLPRLRQRNGSYFLGGR